MSKDIGLNINNVSTKLRSVGQKISGYKVFVFFLLVASLYGYIIWRINAFSNTSPSQSETSAQTVAQPRIDPDTLKKIQSLQDNSVSVQTLFDNARQNPFHE